MQELTQKLSEKKEPKVTLIRNIFENFRKIFKPASEVPIPESQLDIEQQNLLKANQPREALTEREMKNLFRTLLKMAKIFDSNQVNYCVVGGFAIDLLAHHCRLGPLDYKPKDLDFATDRTAIAPLINSGLNFVTLTWTEIYTEDDVRNGMCTTDQETGVKIDVFFNTKARKFPPDEMITLYIDGYPVKVRGFKESREIALDSIKSIRSNGYAPRVSDFIRLEKIRQITDQIEST